MYNINNLERNSTNEMISGIYELNNGFMRFYRLITSLRFIYN